MPLPSESIREILEKAAANPNKSAKSNHDRNNQKLSSPKGVADLFDGGAAGPAATNLGPFPDEQTAKQVIDECAARFLGDVLSRTIAVAGHFCRTTIHSRDVAMALESFVEVDGDESCYRLFPSGAVAEDAREDLKNDEDANEDVDWQEEDSSTSECDHADEEMMDECVLADEEMTAALDDGEDVYAKGTLHSTSTPAFDAVYPPIADIEQLSDFQFRKHLLLPDIERRRSWLPFAIGDDAFVTNNDTRATIMEPEIENCHAIVMLKKALYAFLVAKFSSS